MPKTPDYFQDKCVIVTGAAKGIGRATAHVFAREGAAVMCADVDRDGVTKVAEEVTAAGGRAKAIGADVTLRGDVTAMVEGAKQAFGSVDFLVNSAGGLFRRCSFLEIDDDLWNLVYDVNVKGTFYATQAVLPHMLDQGRGVIVNLGSMAHWNGGPETAVHYASTKGAVVTLTRGVAREFADRGIRCLSISPGYIDTPLQDGLAPDRRQMLESSIPAKRFGRPEEVGEMILFLCSDACEFATADTYFVNGGAGYR